MSSVDVRHKTSAQSIPTSTEPSSLLDIGVQRGGIAKVYNSAREATDKHLIHISTTSYISAYLLHDTFNDSSGTFLIPAHISLDS